MDLPRTPPSRPFEGRAKWGDVLGNGTLAALGGGLAVGALVAIPDAPPAMQALIAYTLAASAATLVLAVATAATRQLPTLHEGRVRSWAGEWWYAVALDLGLAALAATLVAIGLDAGQGWLVLSLLVAVVGAYFAVRALLALTGRRRREGLWVSPDEVGHDAPWGTERVRRDQVARVRASTAADDLVIEVDGPIDRRPCPRPWRRGRVGAGPQRIVVDCSRTGHRAADVAEWLGTVTTSR